ncbi:Terminase OS=Lysinibacillus sphaericus OX=1421 GN=LS41612_10765 PE=4 SV=1 [Lysinibacillus sphaericus]
MKYTNTHWNGTTGQPIKLWDDVMDMIRYGIYTHYQKAILKGKNR